MLDQTLTIILAGDTGAELEPLTRDRAKAAIPFGGEYRVIDFSVSNCLHSGLRQVLVLTRYNSYSLNNHLRDAWSIFNPELGEYVTPVSPQLRVGENLAVGTAGALYQNLHLVGRSRARYVLILQGTHVYRMDYAALLDAHVERGREVSVACVEMDPGRTAGHQQVEASPLGRVSKIWRPGEAPGNGAQGRARRLVSMGVSALSVDLLREALEADFGDADSGHDFDLDVLPRLAETRHVGAYRFGGTEGRVSQDRFWSDLGTLDDYFEGNMALLEPVPPLDLYQDDWAIWSYSEKNPPARTVASASGNEGLFVNSIVSNGTVITGGAVSHSVLCPRVRVSDSATVERSILFNGVEVGAGAQLRNCIVDKRVRIAPGDRIGFDPKRDAERFVVTPKGVVVVPKGHGEAPQG